LSAASTTNLKFIARIEHTWEAIAQVLDGRRLLLLANLFVLLLVRGSLETLPRETSAEKVHEDVTQRLEVISP